jgi:hypothetical protein
MAVQCVNVPVSVNKPAYPGTIVNKPVYIYCTAFDGGSIAANQWINPESGLPWTNPENAQNWINPEK